MKSNKTIKFEGKEYIVVKKSKNPKSKQISLVIKPVKREIKFKSPTIEEILYKIGCC